MFLLFSRSSSQQNLLARVPCVCEPEQNRPNITRTVWLAGWMCVERTEEPAGTARKTRNFSLYATVTVQMRICTKSSETEPETGHINQQIKALINPKSSPILILWGVVVSATIMLEDGYLKHLNINQKHWKNNHFVGL